MGSEEALNGLAGCRICGSSTLEAGEVWSVLARRLFFLRHCPRCRFSFVANPWEEYERIYSADYYEGRGADPLVDYVYELQHPGHTVRRYEWEGILQAIRSLVPLSRDTRWLDFGCGNGGLVRYVFEQTGCRAVGFEEGWIRKRAVAENIPILSRSDLDSERGCFDVVTSIEVLEHIVDPMPVLRTIRRLLKPGGLFLLTTGNAKPFRGRLQTWRYVRPEIHVSYFEPGTLQVALRQAGFRPECRGYLPGFSQIIRFKALKNLRVRRCRLWERVLPWGLLGRLLDWHLQISGCPVAWVPDS